MNLTNGCIREQGSLNALNGIVVHVNILSKINQESWSIDAGNARFSANHMGDCGVRVAHKYFRVLVDDIKIDIGKQTNAVAPAYIGDNSFDGRIFKGVHQIFSAFSGWA